MSRLSAALKQLGDEGFDMLDRAARIGGEIELGVAHEVEAGDELVDDLDELAQLGAAFGSIWVDFVVDLTFDIGSDEEDMSGGDTIITVGGREIEEQFIEFKLQGVFIEGEMPLPIFFMVSASLEIVDFDGFLLRVDINMIKFARERDAVEIDMLRGEINLSLGMGMTEDIMKALNSGG